MSRAASLREQSEFLTMRNRIRISLFSPGTLTIGVVHDITFGEKGIGARRKEGNYYALLTFRLLCSGDVCEGGWRWRVESVDMFYYMSARHC